MAETVETSTSEEKIAYLWRIGWKPKALFGDVLVADAVVFFVRSVRDRLEGTAEIQAMKSLFWKKESYMVPHVCCYKIDLEAQLTQLLKSHFFFCYVEHCYILFIWCMLIYSTLEMANYLHSSSLSLEQRYFTSHFLESRRHFGALWLYTITTPWPTQPPLTICVLCIQRNVLRRICILFLSTLVSFFRLINQFVFNPPRFHQVVFW